MDQYKGRRVLNAVTRVKALDAPRKAFTDMPAHERYANARSERAATEAQDRVLVDAYIANGGTVKLVKPTAKLIRREQTIVYTKLTREGKREMVVANIPAIYRNTSPKKGGVCAGYVYDL